VKYKLRILLEDGASLSGDAEHVGGALTAITEFITNNPDSEILQIHINADISEGHLPIFK